MKILQNNKMKIEYDTARGGISRLVLKNDQHALNWVKSGSGIFGSLYGESNIKSMKYEPNKISATFYYNELEVVFTLTMDSNCAYLDYVFTNKQLNPISFKTGDIGIFAPINDNYKMYSKEKQLNKKCHAHIWCGESSSYIYALRMSGEENNFAVQLVGGQICDYAIIRKWHINDRGDFIFLFRPFTINPMDKIHIRLKLFGIRNENSFYENALSEENYLQINTKKFTYNVGEDVMVELKGKNIDNLNVLCEGMPISVEKSCEDTFFIHGKFESEGIKKFIVKYNNHTTHFDINVIESGIALIDKRLNFIVDNQQISDVGDNKYGAYCLYDFNENKPFYETKANSDKNLGKDRVCMPISILARLLSNIEIDEDLRQKLDNSIKIGMNFIDKTIVSENGVVADSFYKVGVREHLNKYGWYSLLYTMMYEYTNDKHYYDKAVKIISKFYEKGGANAYVSELPILRLIKIAKSLDDDKTIKFLTDNYRLHIQNILKNGIHYPSLDVKFSYEVVAAAINILLDAYELFHRDMYLIETKKLFKILLSFSGKQPSVFMNEATIRHWDCYKYGHSKLYGDNFPNQASVLSAKVLSRYSVQKSKPHYQTRANNILYNAMVLYNGGKASCGYVFPYKINSYTGKKFDLWANNQDWIIYYNLVYNTDIQ